MSASKHTDCIYFNAFIHFLYLKQTKKIIDYWLLFLFCFFGQLARERCALRINFMRTTTSQRAPKTSVICKHIKCNVRGGGKVSVVSKKCNDTK